MSVSLKVKIFESSGTRVLNVTKSTLTIGSASHCDIVLDDPTVAAEHTRAWLESGRIWIQDLGTPGGTALNDIRLPALKPMLVRDLDVLRLGESQSTLGLEAIAVRAPVVKLKATEPTASQPVADTKGLTNIELEKRREEAEKLAREIAELRLHIQMASLEKSSSDDVSQQMASLREETQHMQAQRMKWEESQRQLEVDKAAFRKNLEKEMEEFKVVAIEEARKTIGGQAGQQIDVLSQQIKKIEAELAAEKRHVAEEKQRVADEKMRLAQEQARAADEKQKAEAEKKKLAEHAEAEKRKLLEQAEAEKKRLADQADAEKKRLAEEKQRLANEKQAALEKAAQIDAEKQTLIKASQREVADAKAKTLHDANKVIGDANKSLMEAKQAAAEAQREIAELKKELAESHHHAMSAEKKAIDYQKQYVEATKTAVDTKKFAAIASESAEKSDHQLAELAAENKRLRHERSQLAESLKQAEYEKEAVRKEMKKAASADASGRLDAERKAHEKEIAEIKAKAFKEMNAVMLTESQKAESWKAEVVTKFTKSVQKMSLDKVRQWATRPLSQEMLAEWEADVVHVARRVVLNIDEPMPPRARLKAEAPPAMSGMEVITAAHAPTVVRQMPQLPKTEDHGLTELPDRDGERKETHEEKVARRARRKAREQRQMLRSVALATIVVAILFIGLWVGSAYMRARGQRSLSSQAAAIPAAPVKVAAVPSRPTRFIPRQSRKYRNTYTENVLYLENYVGAEQNIDFHKRWVADLNKIASSEWKIDAWSLAPIAVEEQALIQDLDNIKNNMMTDKVQEGMDKMHAREDKFLRDLDGVFKTRAGTERFLKFKRSFYTRNQAYLTAK